MTGEPAPSRGIAAPSRGAEPRQESPRTPDFFIVGQPKSGTTALYEMLSRHPQIFMGEEKEPWYFAPELRFRPPPREPYPIPETLEQYLSLFAAAAPSQLIGEASTTYLWSREAAGLIAALRPDARVLAILREPADFLRSLHLQFVEAHIETELDFRRALALEAARGEGREIASHTYLPQMLQYAEHVRYAEQLRRYHAVFPPEQVLVLIYDDFRADNAGTLARVLRFLGVDDEFAIEPIEANATVHPRSPSVHELVHALTVGRGPATRALKAAGKAITPAGARRRALAAVRRRVLYGPPPEVDEQLMAELRERFSGEVRELSEYIGRDLVTLWGYEGIA
jgi:hypothetical protein